jgi:hypothetical protein
MSIDEWNTLIKGATAAAVLVTAALGLAKYLDQRELEIGALVRESKKPFLDKQFLKYVEAVTVVSRLATKKQYEGREQDLDRYWRLYWGELGMVEDSGVESAMVGFRRALERLKGGRSWEQVKGQLQSNSLNLSRCVSKSLEKSWNVELETAPCLEDVPDDSLPKNE